MFLVTHQGRGTFKHIAVSVQRVDIHGLALPGALVQEKRCLHTKTPPMSC